MLASHENRFQYVYFILSGIVATALLVLTFVCVKTTASFNHLEEIRQHQKNLSFKKPIFNWDYNNTWRPVGDVSLRHKVFSAYFDARVDIIADINTSDIPIGSFRVFAILPTKFRDVISCITRYEDYSLKEIIAENTRPLPEHHDELFAAFAIICPMRVKPDTKNIILPKWIAITYASNRLSHISPTYIPINYPREMKNIFEISKPIISVCVGPLFGPYDNVMRIVEFVEMYRVLGATHFYFYNFNVTEDVRRILEYYRSQGIADILKWDLKDLEEKIHYQGIVAQYNDCIYRAAIVDNFRYAIVVDLDEVIVPLKHNSLHHYLKQCDEGRTSGFVFRNVFFYKNDSFDTFSVPAHIKNRKLYTQTKIRRSLEILPAHERSKCVVNAQSIVEMGNHKVLKSAPGYAETYVHPHVGLLFHYRDKCLNCKAVLITDFAARRFGSLIWDRVDKTCLQVFMEKNGVCPLE